ncbi:MAG: hypothetical protein AcusKO_30470 [Acuticoccus sp.]
MRRFLLSVSILTVAVPAASAQSFDAATALKGFLTDTATLGADTATVGSVTTDGDTVTASDVALKWVNTFTAEDKTVTIAASMTMPSVAVSGLTPASGGGHSVGEIAAPAATFEVTVEGAPSPVRYTATVTNFTLTDATWGAFPTIAPDPEHPVSRFAPLVDWTVLQSYKNTTVENVALEMVVDTDVQNLAYGPVSVGPVENGRIERVEYPPFTVRQSGEMPTDDGGTEQVEVVINYGRFVAEKVDFQPFAQFLTGSGSATGPTPLMASQTLGTTTVEVEDKFKLTLGSVDVEDITVDPTRGPLLAKLDPVIKDLIAKVEPQPLVLARLALDAYGALGIGRYVFDDMSAEGPDFNGKLASIGVEGIDANGMKRFAIEGGSVESAEGSGALELFEIRDVAFPDRAAILARVESAMAGVPFGPADLKTLPKLGGLSLKGLSALPTGLPGDGVKLGLFDISMSDFVASIPRALSVDISGLEVPLELVQEPMAQAVLGSLGANPVKADAAVALTYNAADSTFTLDKDVAIDKVGKLTADAALSGIPAVIFENPMRAQEAIATAAINGLTVDFDDEGITAFVVGMMAQEAGISAGDFVNAISQQIGMQVAMLTRDNNLGGQLAETARTFLSDPQRLLVQASPSAPVSVAQLLGAAAAAPQMIPQILNLTITANQ